MWVITINLSTATRLIRWLANAHDEFNTSFLPLSYFLIVCLTIPGPRTTSTDLGISNKSLLETLISFGIKSEMIREKIAELGPSSFEYRHLSTISECLWHHFEIFLTVRWHDFDEIEISSFAPGIVICAPYRHLRIVYRQIWSIDHILTIFWQ